jgi:hypothetical protein
MDVGLKNAISRLKRQMKRRKAWLLASVVLFAIVGLYLYDYIRNEEEVYMADSSGSETVAIMMDGRSQLLSESELWYLLQDGKPAYLALNAERILTLYSGEPGAGTAIQTYFQVDMDYLRQSVPEPSVKDLEEGIPIMDYEEFSSVLSTFSGYELEDAD